MSGGVIPCLPSPVEGQVLHMQASESVPSTLRAVPTGSLRDEMRAGDLTSLEKVSVCLRQCSVEALDTTHTAPGPRGHAESRAGFLGVWL